jgi:lysozyme
MDKQRLMDMLADHEGMRLKVYDDSNGKALKSADRIIGHLTIGVGRNVAADGLGISEEEARFLLLNDIARIEKEIARWPIDDLNEPRLAVIIDMTFNMGMTRFNPQRWPNMFRAVVNEDWEEAGKQMLSSNWARQVKRRSVRLAEMMQTGEWVE